MALEPSEPPEAPSPIDAARAVLQARRLARITHEELEQLGSSQNRSNSFQPHHSLHRPESASTLSLKHLLASAAHLGHAKERTDPAAYAHIYGFRHGIAIIDVRETLTALRRAAAVVKGVVEQDGIVVFVGSPNRGIDRAVTENAKRLGPNGFAVTRWQPGTISNASKIYASTPMPEGNSPKDTVTPFTLQPSLLVLLSPTTSQHAIREATRANIPTIAITDSNVDPRAVTYPIPANDDSPRAVELIAGVLGVAGKAALADKKVQVRSPRDIRQRNFQLGVLAGLREMEEEEALRLLADS